MKIMCYGDSNTWGYIPNINGYSKNAIMQQYKECECWWYDLMQQHEVIINGLCGRCIAHENRWLRNRNANQTIYDDLQEHCHLDLIILQLGTNDCKTEYNDSAKDIVNNLENLIAKIKPLAENIAIICPPTIYEDSPITSKYYVGAQSKSKQLNKLYKNLAEKNNLVFISGTDLDIGEDGEHLSTYGHQQLKSRVNEAVTNLFFNAVLE